MILLNCILVCLLYNIPVDVDGGSYDITSTPTCFRYDNTKQYNRLEKQLGSTSDYRIYNGSVIQSYVYGGSTTCRPDTKHEMDIIVVSLGGESDAHIRACRE